MLPLIGHGYLGLFLATLALSLLAYGLCWERGPFADDYALRDRAVDVVTGVRNPFWSLRRIDTFPVRTLNWVVTGVYAASIPHQERIARAIASLIIVGNAALLGWLVYRALGARLPAIVAAWLFLVPFFAQEAILWAGAIGYPVATALALSALHCFVTALFSLRRWRWILCGLLPFAACLFAIEQAVLLVGLLPVIALCMARNPACESGNRHPVRGALLLLVSLVGMGALIATALYRGTVPQVSGRGGFVRTPAEIAGKASEFISCLQDKTVTRWGRTLTAEAFHAGWQLQTSGAGVLLLGLTAACVVTVVCRWRGGRPDYRAPLTSGIALFTASAAGAFLAILFPAGLLRGQILEYRMLYVPAAFAACSIGTAAWLAGRVVQRERLALAWEKSVILTAGVAAWFGGTCVAGYAVSYAERARLDAQQLASIGRILSLAPLPHNVMFVPFASDEQLQSAGPCTSLLLAGVLEKPYAAHCEFARILRRRDFRVLFVNRWGGLNVALTKGPGDAPLLQLNDAVLDPGEVVLLTCRRNEAAVVRRMSLRKPEMPDVVIDFPLAEMLARKGAPAIAGVVDAGVPQFRLRTE